MPPATISGLSRPSLVGPQLSVISGGIVCLGLTVLIVRTMPGLARYVIRHEEPAAQVPPAAVMASEAEA